MIIKKSIIINDLKIWEKWSICLLLIKMCFYPLPHVDSAIIKIVLTKKPNLKLYEILNVCFKQRRKTIYNNLKKNIVMHWRY